MLLATGSASEDELIAALEEARDAQLVVESERDDGPAYAFTHALVRHALYSGLSGPRRRRLHARAAAAIEAVHGDGEVAALALHHRLAGSAGDPEQALEWSMRAAAQAASRFAWEETAAHWEGALAVMTRAGGRERERADLLVALGDLMVVVGDLERQIAFLEQALALYDGLGDVERSARVHSRLGMARSLMDSVAAEHLDIGAAFRHFDAARAVLGQGPPRRAAGHLEVGVATARTYALQIGPGLEAAQRGMEIAEAVGDELLWAGAAEAYGWHALVAGRLHEGFDAQARAFAVADRHQRPFLAFMAANIQGQFTWGIGAPDDAQAHFERPLRLAYAGDAANRGQSLDGLGRCHASRGELAEAAPAAPRRDRELDHAFARPRARPVGRGPRGRRAAGRGDARHQPPDREPLGRLGIAPARCPRARAARRARRRRGAARGRDGDRRRRRGGVLRAVGAPRPGAGAGRDGPCGGGARARRPLPRDRGPRRGLARACRGRRARRRGRAGERGARGRGRPGVRGGDRRPRAPIAWRARRPTRCTSGGGCWPPPSGSTRRPRSTASTGPGGSGSTASRRTGARCAEGVGGDPDQGVTESPG